MTFKKPKVSNCTQAPVMLTGNGKAEMVVQGAESYQEALESKDRMDAINIIRERLATMKQSKGRSAEEFFNEFFAEHRVDTP